MYKQDLMIELERWAKTVTAVDSVMDDLSKVIGATHDSRLGDAVYNMMGFYTAELDRRLRADGLLNWYQWGNDMGAKGLKADPHGDMNLKPVRNLEDLAQLIVEFNQD
jgi:hypothetical protein